MELSAHQDKILNAIERYKAQEAERASDAGEMREDIGNLIEFTGLNKKAFSFVRSVDKLPEDKRNDVLRSLHPLLDMMDKHWNGQSTPDMLDRAAAPEKPAAPATEADVQQFAPDAEEGGGPEIEPFDPDLEADDADFKKQLRAVN